MHNRPITLETPHGNIYTGNIFTEVLIVFSFKISLCKKAHQLSNKILLQHLKIVDVKKLAVSRTANANGGPLSQQELLFYSSKTCHQFSHRICYKMSIPQNCLSKSPCTQMELEHIPVMEGNFELIIEASTGQYKDT